jgi:chaperonin GroES
MGGSDQRLWHKERQLVQKATGDRTIESAKDLRRWEARTGQAYVAPSEHDNIMRRATAIANEPISDKEATEIAEEYRTETFGNLPGEKIIRLDHDRVLVQMLPVELSSVLFIPDKVKGKPQKGRVLMVGPGRLSRDGTKVVSMEVKRGDIVITLQFSGMDVGDDKRLLEEDEILAVLK